MFEGYCVITQLHSHDAVYQKAVFFLYCIWPVGVKIYNSLTFADDEDENDIKIIMTKLDTYFIGESNETYERYVFNKRDQQGGETVDAYVANLRTLAKTCNFGDQEESLIKDRLVLGINDPGTRKTLLQTRNLTLQDAVDICKTDEATRNQLKSIDTESVNKMQQKKGNGQQRDKKSVPKKKRLSRAKHATIVGKRTILLHSVKVLPRATLRISRQNKSTKLRTIRVMIMGG